MESAISDFLPYTFEKNTALKSINRMDGVLGYASSDEIKLALGNTKVLVRSADNLGFSAKNLEKVEGTLTVKTTTDNPSVICLFGAGPCSLNLVFDKEGNAIGVHRQIIDPNEDQEAVTDINRYTEEFLNEGVGIINDESVLLISGTNVNNDLAKARDFLISTVRKNNFRMRNYAHQEIAEVLVKPTESEYEKTTPRGDLFRKLIQVLNQLKYTGNKKPVVPVSVREVTGIIFIPKQIDSQHKNRILLIDQVNQWDIPNAILEI